MAWNLSRCAPWARRSRSGAGARMMANDSVPAVDHSARAGGVAHEHVRQPHSEGVVDIEREAESIGFRKIASRPAGAAA